MDPNPEREIGNLLPNNQRQRRTCYALCHILYPVSARCPPHCTPFTDFVVRCTFYSSRFGVPGLALRETLNPKPSNQAEEGARAAAANLMQEEEAAKKRRAKGSKGKVAKGSKGKGA